MSDHHSTIFRLYLDKNRQRWRHVNDKTRSIKAFPGKLTETNVRYSYMMSAEILHALENVPTVVLKYASAPVTKKNHA